MRKIITLLGVLGLAACSDGGINNDAGAAARTVEYGPWQVRQHITLLGEPIEGAYVSSREAWLKSGDTVLATCTMRGDPRLDASGQPVRGEPPVFKMSGDCGFITVNDNGELVTSPEQWTSSS